MGERAGVRGCRKLSAIGNRPLTLTLSPALRGRGNVMDDFHDVADTAWRRQKLRVSDQGLTFTNMGADRFPKRDHLAPEFPVAPGVAISQRRTAFVRKLFLERGAGYSIF